MRFKQLEKLNEKKVTKQEEKQEEGKGKEAKSNFIAKNKKIDLTHRKDQPIELEEEMED